MRRMMLAGMTTALAACQPMRTSVTPSAGADFLITNARIVDGTGNPWYRGSVAVTGDRITYVGPSVSGLTAKRVIDARDQVVSPGFIDMLGHSEDVLPYRPHAESKVTQGITSEVTGEVSSAWPNLALGQKPNPREPWTSLGQYFDLLDRQGAAINLATYVGTSSVREAVMGDATRNPTAAEMMQMGALIDSAMKDGAVGVGTGLIYLPSTFFTTDELIALTKYATPYKGGYAAHIRHEDNRLPDAVRETVRIASEAGTWAEIRHIKARTPELMAEAIRVIDSARAAGVDISADQYPYIASSTGLAAMLNTWVQEGGRDSLVARLRDPAVRARLKRELAEDSASGIRTAARTMVSGVRADSLRKYVGLRLTEIGKLRNEDPYDAAFDILMGDRGGTSAIYFSFDENAVKMAMKQPWVSVGQDAGSVSPDSTGTFHYTGHPRAFGTFPRILGRYVRQDSIITLEFAVRKMTSLAAQRVGLTDRGTLKTGMYADIAVFDPNTVIDNSTYENPGQVASGVSYVMVNGVLTMDNGKLTGTVPGRALRSAWYRAHH
jgi:N-acyl-D-aspartate/D-glutamate deacylase